MVKKLPNHVKAEIYKVKYKDFKVASLDTYGYFPIFVSFRDNLNLKKINGNALKLYIYLGLKSDNWSGETWVSIETMAEYFGKSKRAISNWLKELEEMNLIKRLQLNKDDVSHTYLRPY